RRRGGASPRTSSRATRRRAPARAAGVQRSRTSGNLLRPPDGGQQSNRGLVGLGDVVPDELADAGRVACGVGLDDRPVLGGGAVGEGIAGLRVGGGGPQRRRLLPDQ